MKDWIKKRWRVLAAVLVGALLGYIYYIIIGCESGSCPITSSPIYSSLWGALIGLIFIGLPCKGCSKNKKDNE